MNSQQAGQKQELLVQSADEGCEGQAPACP